MEESNINSLHESYTIQDVPYARHHSVWWVHPLKLNWLPSLTRCLDLSSKGFWSHPCMLGKLHMENSNNPIIWCCLNHLKLRLLHVIKNGVEFGWMEFSQNRKHRKERSEMWTQFFLFGPTLPSCRLKLKTKAIDWDPGWISNTPCQAASNPWQCGRRGKELLTTMFVLMNMKPCDLVPADWLTFLQVPALQKPWISS